MRLRDESVQRKPGSGQHNKVRLTLNNATEPFADESTVYHWNPLVHSDDALNLMAVLQMLVDYSARGHSGTGDVTVACGFNIYVWEPKKGDVPAATRRAITRTAAAIGKNR